MNYKFSIKIAALLATFTGTSIGPATLAPSNWLASANAQTPTAASEQAQPRAHSKMLAPMVPPVHKPDKLMPWQVEPSRYQSAIAPTNGKRPTLLAPASIRKNTVPVPEAKVYTPQAQHAVGNATDAATSKVQQAAALLTAPAQGRVSSGFSAAGIPLYPSGAPTTQAVPYSSSQTTFQPNTPVTQVASAALAATTPPQGSGSRGAIGSGIAPGAPGPAFPAPPVISPGSERLLAPSSGSGTRTEPSSVLTNPGQIVPTPVVSNPVASSGSSVGGGSCNTCDTGGALGCDSSGGCNCGPNGCFNPADIANNAGLYGSVGEARFYGHLEALLITRDDGDISLSTIGNVGDFDFDGGWRATFGERFDAINGREISYFGTAEISDSSSFTGTIQPTFVSPDLDVQPFGFVFPGRADSFGTPGTPAEVVDGVLIPATPATPPETALAPANIFATTQSQFTETSLQSIEFNRVRWGWDVFKSFVGIRYIYFDDRYELNSVNPGLAADQTGNFQLYAQNNLIGPNIGAEWFYDVGYRLSVSSGIKGGIYANFNELDTRLNRGATNLLNNEDENTSFATTLDWNLIAHYQISPRGRFRVGYNVTYLGDVATVSDNQPSVVGPFGPVVVSPATISAATGTDASDSDYVTFHGFSFGLEFFR